MTDNPSMVFETKVKPFGSSFGFNLTGQLRDMGFKQGDKVLVRMSEPTQANIYIDTIAQMIESGDYDPVSTSFFLTNDYGEQSPSQYFGEHAEEHIDFVDDLYTKVMRYIIDFTSENLHNTFAFYDPDQHVFKRTFPKSDYLDQYLDVESILDRESLSVNFISGLIDLLGLRDFKLEMTKTLAKVATQCADAYTSFKEIGIDAADYLEELNGDTENYNSVLMQDGGYYVTLTSLQHHRDGQYVREDPEFGMEFALSRDSLLERMKQRIESEEEGNSFSIKFDVYGPLDREQSRQFLDYLNLAVRINCDKNDFEGIDRFCTSQFNIFNQRLKKELSGEAEPWPSGGAKH